MKIHIHIRACIVLFFVALGAGCGSEPLLTEMGTNRLMVVLKGTYESNSPMDWDMPAPTDGDYGTLVMDDSVDDCDEVGPNPALLMVDLAEMKLVDSKGKDHRFSNYRQTYSFLFSDYDPFFNGSGVVLENDDVPTRKSPYIALGLYVRKMLMDSAIRYTPSADGWRSLYVWDSFDSRDLPSFNFNTFQVYSFYDTLRYEKTHINRVYPIIIPISDLETGNPGLFYDRKPPLTVLEVRMVVKNFVKKYEYGAYPDQNHYFALSDWLQNVEPDETNIGGNILAVARAYIPGMTGRISGSNPAGGGRHIIAVPAGASIENYTLDVDPYGSSIGDDNVRSNNPCNLPMPSAGYVGGNISLALDYLMKNEHYRARWNDYVPTECSNFTEYQENWNTFAAEVGNFKIPPLAVYAEAGNAFSIENVSPGRYDLYIATVAPRYGTLYYTGEFTPSGDNPVTVGAGTTAVVSFP